MATIIKSSSGFLFSEDKWDDLSLLWDLSPNDPSRVALTSDSISLLPGVDRLELLLPAPMDNGYVMQSEIEYAPKQSAEKAGCVLKSLTNSIIELEVCGDTDVNCKYSKIIVDDDHILDAKVSLDSNMWVDYGNTRAVDMNKLGYYIESNLDTVLKVKNCTMYKNNTVILNGFDRKNIMKLFDSNMNEITDKFYIKKKNAQMTLDGTNIMYPIKYLKMQVLDRDTGEVYHEGELNDVYGGDIYEYNYNIEVYVDEILLDNTMHSLGPISGEKIFNVKITNKESYPLKDKNIKVSYYSVYNKGNKLAKIAFENGDNYLTTLNTNFAPGETKLFKLKIARDNTFISIEDEYKFNIILE